jgi:hypothetical protein
MWGQRKSTGARMAGRWRRRTRANLTGIMRPRGATPITLESSIAELRGFHIIHIFGAASHSIFTFPLSLSDFLAGKATWPASLIKFAPQHPT